MTGLPKPKVMSNLEGRQKVLDTAIDAPTATPVAAPATPVRKPITAAEARANQDARDAKDAADEIKRKGMVKPSLLDRAKKLIGG